MNTYESIVDGFINDLEAIESTYGDAIESGPEKFKEALKRLAQTVHDTLDSIEELDSNNE